MFNKNKIIISAGAFALALFGACSDERSTAGATVDPDVLAENDSISTSFIDSLVSIEFKTKPTSYSLVSGKIDVFEEENGAVGSCTGDNRIFTKMIRIYNDGISEKVSVENMGTSCDSAFAAFMESCESRKGEFTDLASKCTDGAFNAFCVIHDKAHENDKEAFDAFFDDVAETCEAITANAKTSTGRYETPTSSFSKGDIDAVPKSSSSEERVIYPIYPSDSSDKKDDDGEVDVPSTGILVTTLDNYTAQFTDDPAELSFDSHVLAYNGYASCSVINERESIIKAPNELYPRLYSISTDEIEECFPETAEAAKAIEYKFKENCNYYVATSSDGSQPTGHTITKVAKDTIEFTSVHTGGMCMLSQQFFHVMYLIEDCDNLISESTKTTSKKFTSETWACEEGSYSPTKSAGAYGEWFRADLIFP